MNTETFIPVLAATETKRPRRTKDDHLDEALERVFQKYGSDLSAFLRDVTDEMSSKQQMKIDNRATRLRR